MAPDFKNGADTGVRLKQQKLPPLLPTDLNITIFIHSGTDREMGGRGEREGEGRERERRGRDYSLA
jgi:hypothetical protein